jgi:alpha-L-arabinofuranosidase
MKYGVKYWEIGNELGGGWESGTVRADGKSMDGAMYGGIYSEFARAMKKADESIWVGSQGGVDFIRGALSHKEAPVDFVTFHDYYNAENTSLEARFATLDRIRGQIAEVQKAIDELRPGSDIPIGITEYNCKLFEDEETADVVSGLWTVAAVGEMLYGGLDFATQWDTFTQKKAQGGGHGFMLEEGFVPKAEYWSFYLLNHYLGSELLEVQEADARLRVTASRDAAGNVYVIAVNTHASDTAAASLR